MARRRTTDDVDPLPAREAARTRARDRKRSTRMVVDNAGIRRILLARRARREVPPARDTDAAPPR